MPHGTGQSTTLRFPPLLPLYAGYEYRLAIDLLAAPSDGQGNPIVPSTPVVIGTAEGDAGIRVQPRSGPANVTGNVGAVTVNQPTRNPGFIRAGMGLPGLQRYLSPLSMTRYGYSTNR